MAPTRVPPVPLLLQLLDRPIIEAFLAHVQPLARTGVGVLDEHGRPLLWTSPFPCACGSRTRSTPAPALELPAPRPASPTTLTCDCGAAFWVAPAELPGGQLLGYAVAGPLAQRRQGAQRYSASAGQGTRDQARVAALALHDFLAAVSAQAASVADLAQRYEEREDSAQQAALLASLYALAARAGQEPGAIGKMAQLIAEAVDADAAACDVVDSGFSGPGEDLRVRGTWGYITAAGRHHRSRLGQGLSGRVAQGQALLCTDMLADARLYLTAATVREGLHSYAGVPLWRAGQPRGSLNVYRRRIQAFTEADLQLLATLAPAIDHALDLEDLWQESRLQADQLQAEAQGRAGTTAALGQVAALQAALTTLADSGASLATAVQTIAEVLEAQVAVLDAFGNPLAAAGTPDPAAPSAPLVVVGQSLGSLVVHLPAPMAPLAEHIAVAAAAGLSGLLARPQREEELRRQLGQGFLVDLLHGAAPTDEARLLCALLGLDLARSYRVAVLAGVTDPLQLTALAARLPASAWAVTEQCGVLVVPAGPPRELLEAALAQGSLAEAVVTVGSPGQLPADLHRSFTAAYRTLDIARARTPRRPLFYEDLGIYGLLYQAVDAGALRDFAYQNLQALLDYDRETRSELVQTLAALLQQGGHIRRAAADLHVHVNTLLYRKRKLEELLGVSIDDGEVRQRLHLALSTLAVQGAVPLPTRAPAPQPQRRRADA